MNPRLLAFLRLIRFSNAPTAVADIVAGYLLATGSVLNWGPLFGLSLASVCLYSFGMALNDLYDLPEDRQHSPERPLVTGALPLAGARLLTFGLWGLGLIAAGGAGYAFQAGLTADALEQVATHSALPPWTWPLAIVLPLTLAIWLYDGPAKRTALAPFLMGSCRGLNLLLGASLPLIAVMPSEAIARASWGPLSYWSNDVLGCAAAMTVYVTGITWYARSESKGPQIGHLILGLTFLTLGILMLAWGLVVLPARPLGRADLGSWSAPQLWWPGAMLLLNFSVLRKAVVGIWQPTEANVRVAIIGALGNLIFLNAAICLYANPQQWPVAVAVVGLIIPIKFLRRSIPPT